jgi:hypothetical protein
MHYVDGHHAPSAVRPPDGARRLVIDLRPGRCHPPVWESGRVAGGARDESGWDFFVSYTQVDRAWAEWIAWLLEEDGYRVLFQAWDMVAGSNWISRMDQGVQRAARTVAVLSPDYRSSVYGTAEWQVAWAGDPQGLQRKLITVRVRGDWPAGLLASVVGIDLVGLSETETRRRLRDEIAAAVRGRAKPDTPPPFPLTLRAVSAQPRFPGVRVLHPSAAFWDAQPSSFGRDAPLVGRDDELGRLCAALKPAADSPRNRVVVVEGPGGIGKTRLVVEAGRAYPILVARTGTALSVDDLGDVPVDVPSVIVVNDAHRSPHLSGLAAMVGDPRYAGVTVVLTVRRPGGSNPSAAGTGSRQAHHDHLRAAQPIRDQRDCHRPRDYRRGVPLPCHRHRRRKSVGRALSL